MIIECKRRAVIENYRRPEMDWLTEMNPNDLITEIVGTYLKHGWQLRRLLLRAETQAEFDPSSLPAIGEAVKIADIDAAWFARPSHGEREAWELRLLAENPFALFETFEKDETEAEREDLRCELEARMREYAGKESGLSPES